MSSVTNGGGSVPLADGDTLTINPGGSIAVTGDGVHGVHFLNAPEADVLIEGDITTQGDDAYNIYIQNNSGGAISGAFDDDVSIIIGQAEGAAAELTATGDAVANILVGEVGGGSSYNLVEVENHGALTVDDNGSSAANAEYNIYVDALSITALTNSGILSVTGGHSAYGIGALAVNNHITALSNSGIITANAANGDAYGIDAQSVHGDINTLTNTGNISASTLNNANNNARAYGISAQTDNRDIDTIINDASAQINITAPNGGGAGIQANADSGNIGTVANAGMIAMQGGSFHDGLNVVAANGSIGMVANDGAIIMQGTDFIDGIDALADSSLSALSNGSGAVIDIVSGNTVRGMVASVIINSIGTISNDGAITLQGGSLVHGISAQAIDDGNISEMRNNGVITLQGASDVRGLSARIDNGGVGTISNTGAISADMAGNDGYGIFVETDSGSIGVVANDGVISIQEAAGGALTSNLQGMRVQTSLGVAGTVANNNAITVQGDSNVYGIQAETIASLFDTVANGGTIDVQGDSDVYGLYAHSGMGGGGFFNTIANTGLISASAAAGNAYGISAHTSGQIGTITNAAGAQINITALNGAGFGIWTPFASSAASRIDTLTNAGAINIQGSNTAYGIGLNADDIGAVFNSGLITLTGADSIRGISADAQNGVTALENGADGVISISATGNNPWGMLASSVNGGIGAIVNNGAINVQGNNLVLGMWGHADSGIVNTVSNNGALTVQGGDGDAYALGVRANDGSIGTVSNSGAISVATSDSTASVTHAYGLAAFTNSTVSGNINSLENTGSISANAVSTTSSGAVAYGIWTQANGSGELTALSNSGAITASAASGASTNGIAYGIWVLNSGNVGAVSNSGTITLDGGGAGLFVGTTAGSVSDLSNSGTILVASGPAAGMSIRAGTGGLVTNSGGITVSDFDVNHAIEFTYFGVNDTLRLTARQRAFGRIVMDGDGSGADTIEIGHTGFNDIPWRLTVDNFDPAAGDTLIINGQDYLTRDYVNVESDGSGGVVIKIALDDTAANASSLAGAVLGDVGFAAAETVTQRIDEALATANSTAAVAAYAPVDTGGANGDAPRAWHGWGKVFGGLKKREDSGAGGSQHSYGGLMMGFDMAHNTPDAAMLGLYGGYAHSLSEFDSAFLQPVEADMFFGGIYGRALDADSGLFADSVASLGYVKGGASSSQLVYDNLSGLTTIGGGGTASGPYVMANLRVGRKIAAGDSLTLIPSARAAYAHQWRHVSGGGDSKVSTLSGRLQLAARMNGVTRAGNSWTAELRSGVDLRRDFLGDLGLEDEAEIGVFAAASARWQASEKLSLSLDGELTFAKDTLGATANLGVRVRF